MSKDYLFTSESVTEGHPDKICDQVSDAILDACFQQDSMARVAIECVTKTGMILITGELTTTAYVDIPGVARQVLKEIGYIDAMYGIDSESCAVLTAISEQSPDIAQGVDATNQHEQGAGDQGMMIGYAINETPEYMPLSIMLAHRLAQKLAEVRKKNEINYLRPDGKSQVTIEYKNGQPSRAHTIVVSTQHNENVAYEQIKKDVIEHVIKPVCHEYLDKDTIFHVNPTGTFVRGGPYADSGLTGRKIIVDTYGGHGGHGGGSFSGKDPSKVDRSAAYMARYIAKNIVAAGLAEKFQVELAYAIGVAEPVSIFVDCFGTNKISEDKIIGLIKKHFPLKPADIIRELDLRRPIFRQTACYGHFGRELPDFTWEKTDKVEILKNEAMI